MAFMTDLLALAKDDLTRLETEAENARLGYERAVALVEDQRAFVQRLSQYATGFTAVEQTPHLGFVSSLPRAVPHYPVIDGQRRMALTIPREGTKRHEIGNAVIAEIITLGPMTTSQLLQKIPAELFQGSSNPRNYLSNALSKDARFKTTPAGWDIVRPLTERQEAMEGA